MATRKKIPSFFKYFSWITFVITGFILGTFYSADISDFIIDRNPLSSEKDQQKTYIDPYINSQKTTLKYVPFELKTSKRIFEEINRDKNISLSVYVRNLDNGPWFGIGEDDTFAPIRTLKMPIFIAYLKWSEEENGLLGSKLPIPASVIDNTEKIFIPKSNIQPWQSYSIKTLLEEMMINSSIIATEVLLKNIPYTLLSKVDADLGVLLPWEEDIRDTISLKEYSSFYRILYTASYLSSTSSDFALSTLTKTDFPQWLRKGIPSNIEIANKYGEKIYTDEQGEKIYQLHDCWVVYYTKYPYIICISAKSKNTDKLTQVIGETSRIVFEEISKAYPKN